MALAMLFGAREALELQPRSYARATATSRKNSPSSSKGFGSLRMSFHTTMLIDLILRARGGSPRMNLSARPSRLGKNRGLAHLEFPVRVMDCPILRQTLGGKASTFYDLDPHRPN
jgi:hypothetical protein